MSEILLDYTRCINSLIIQQKIPQCVENSYHTYYKNWYRKLWHRKLLTGLTVTAAIYTANPL